MFNENEYGPEVGDYRLLRRGINRFLHAVYDERRYLSQILHWKGLKEQEIVRLRKIYLNRFLEKLVATWCWWLQQVLSPEAVTLLIRHYSLDGEDAERLSAGGRNTGALSEQLWVEALSVLRQPEQMAIMEHLVLLAAHRTLYDAHHP